MAEFACRTCRDTYSVEAGADGVGRMTYDPCPDCTEPRSGQGHRMSAEPCPVGIHSAGWCSPPCVADAAAAAAASAWRERERASAAGTDGDPYDEDDDWWEDAVTRPIEDVVVVGGVL